MANPPSQARSTSPASKPATAGKAGSAKAAKPAKAAGAAKKTATATAAEAKSSATAEPAAAAKPAETTQRTADQPLQSTITVTLPVEHVVAATVAVARVPVAIAKIPVAAVRRVVPAKNGIPLYAGVGALAIVGAVEWPVAAAAGAGLVALRRWGPLRAK